jgi:hypothetical protein
MNRIPRSLCAAAAVAFVLVGQAQAQLLNGDFSNGLTNWNPQGDASISSGAAFLTTAINDGSDDTSNFNVSGTSPLNANVALGLEESTGLAIGGADLGIDPAFEGSGLSQTFSLPAGLYQLSFSYNFFTNEVTAFDHAYVGVNGTVYSFADSSDAIIASTPYITETGLQNFVQVFTSTGTVTLSLGVADIASFDLTSAVLIDGITLTAIPEPSTYAALVGSLALGFVALRRRRAI